ncbi:hypothetical protein C8Q80DRAFT_1274464 [Daedaleopsis nitida]|nr:hypothetical protein C8Q80DRAFT_1274464 [Daedaleopsis nitida]
MNDSSPGPVTTSELDGVMTSAVAPAPTSSATRSSNRRDTTAPRAATGTRRARANLTNVINDRVLRSTTRQRANNLPPPPPPPPPAAGTTIGTSPLQDLYLLIEVAVNEETYRKKEVLVANPQPARDENECPITGKALDRGSDGTQRTDAQTKGKKRTRDAEDKAEGPSPSKRARTKR